MNPLSVRYVLYTHYPEGSDWEKYKELETPPDKLEGVQFLVRHLSGLRGLLTWPGYEGFLVLFYSPGLSECLEGIEEQQSIEELQETCKALEFAKTVHDYLNDLMRTEYQELLPRLRFITAIDLHKIFGRITNSAFADRLKGWMVGDTEGIRYDSPKIVEAIVRLRLLGSGVPVFRVDYDVLLRDKDNRDKKNLEFSSTIGSCLMAYQLRRDSPNLSSFIFSASYDHKILRDPRATDDFHAWGQAYATRVFPALRFDKALITQTLHTINKQMDEASRSQAHEEKTKAAKDKTPEEEAKQKAANEWDLKEAGRKIVAQAWDSYAEKAFSAPLARKFFGFNDEQFVVSESGGIGEIGAHPMASVISGAMLYLSDGAILDLPPFSNFSLNVSWIDDHLKYCLHRELRHLRRPTLDTDGRELKRNDLLTYSKIDNVIVQKAGRKIDKDLRWYIFDVYLPTLLRGTMLDAWITPDPLLKYRSEELTEENRDACRELIERSQSGGLLASALQRSLAACRFTRKARVNLETKLKHSALKRITQVRQQWAALRDNEVGTFASIWANGQARSYCPDLKLKYSGIVTNPNLALDQELTIYHLSPAVSEDLNQLIKDACNYIDWTRDWPTIVQVVRSIEQGTLRTDLNYDHERAQSSA